MFKILRVFKTNTYDVFFGEGWDNHTRVKYGHRDNTLEYVYGSELTPFHRFHLKQEIKQHKQNYNPVIHNKEISK